jgi:hypothetical protein
MPSTTNPAQDPRPAPEHATAPRAIFRPEAIRRYVAAQEKIELPRLLSPRAFSYLWGLAILLTVAGFLIGFWPWLSGY